MAQSTGLELFIIAPECIDLTLWQTTKYRLIQIQCKCWQNLGYDSNNEMFVERVENTEEREKMIATSIAFLRIIKTFDCVANSTGIHGT